MAGETVLETASSPIGAMVPAVFRVAERRREMEDAWTLTLEPEEGGSAPRFEPGQIAMLYAFGVGEIPISVSGDPAHPERLVHTVREVGAASTAVCAAEPGTGIGVRGPFGRPWPLADAEGSDLVIVAGGIGLAPLRPVIYHALAHRERFGELVILYGGRSPRELLYADELARWAGRQDAAVRVTVDRAGADWPGRVGVVTKLIPRAPFDPDHAVAMVCGPEVMMRFATTALLERGVAKQALHVSLERSMRCAVGHCGHCQLAELFICKDGPVFRYDRVEPLLEVREL